MADKQPYSFWSSAWEAALANKGILSKRAHDSMLDKMAASEDAGRFDDEQLLTSIVGAFERGDVNPHQLEALQLKRNSAVKLLESNDAATVDEGRKLLRSAQSDFYTLADQSAAISEGNRVDARELQQEVDREGRDTKEYDRREGMQNREFDRRRALDKSDQATTAYTKLGTDAVGSLSKIDSEESEDESNVNAVRVAVRDNFDDGAIARLAARANAVRPDAAGGAVGGGGSNWLETALNYAGSELSPAGQLQATEALFAQRQKERQMRRRSLAEQFQRAGGSVQAGVESGLSFNGIPYTKAQSSNVKSGAKPGENPRQFAIGDFVGDAYETGRNAIMNTFPNLPSVKRAKKRPTN